MTNDPKKKNIVQDVLPPKRSIRNVEFPSQRRVSNDAPAPRPLSKPEPITQAKQDPFIRPVSMSRPRVSEVTPVPARPRSMLVEPVEPPPPEKPTYAYEYTEPPHSSKKILYSSLVVFILVAAFGISALFKSAVITLTPRNESQTLDAVFTAKKDAAASSLGFQIVTVSKNVEKTVVASGQEQANDKATGRIVVYNNYSTQPQNLVVNTRFQTPEGLIFHLIAPITIPGRTTQAGKTIAGSIEVGVVADAAGDTYNVGLKDFTIPGFKGDPRYTQLYGRSKTVMTGGFVGKRMVVGPDTVASADAELETLLKASLSKDLAAEIPANFILYDADLSYSFSPALQVTSSSSDAVIRKSGTVNAIIFDKGALSRAITESVLPDVTDDMVKVTNMEDMVFTYATSTPVDSSLLSTISFHLKGNANFVWIFDQNKLKSDLLGLSKKSAREIIATYPAIHETWIETKPFWNQTIPLDPKKVTVVNTLDK